MECVFVFMYAYINVCNLAADSNDEVEPIDLWEEEDESEPEVCSCLGFNIYSTWKFAC